MAEIFIHQEVNVFVQVTARTISGTATVGGSAAARMILVYKNNDLDLYATTISNASTGDWSVDVVANANDRFRVITVGAAGENSAISEQVVAG